MKIAITSTGPTLDDTVEARFGRCAYFLIIDPDTLEFESIPNPNLTLGGGAGLQSAQLMAGKNVSTVLTGNCGPNAFQIFGAAGIQVITGVGGRIRQAVERYKSGEMVASPGPSVQSHFGTGRGRGIGGGRGFGRAMAGSGALGPATDKRSQLDSLPDKEELDRLREQARVLRKQLNAVEADIRKIEGE